MKKSQKLLKESIFNWERERSLLISGNELEHPGCPLCKEYEEFADADNECKGCPVMEASGKTLCDNTPFYVMQENLKYYDDEILFLKSLVEA